eukprot:jgi/Ulvmu1/138/UM001_0142.1
MPNAKGRSAKGKAKAKPAKDDVISEEPKDDVEMAGAETAEEAQDNDDNAEGDKDDAWQTKAELEAIEAEINAESLVLTKAKSSREPPSSLVLPLLPYQKEFLAWAIEQETGPVRGGILADEMGLGKTLQAVSLIVTHPREGQILGPDDGAPAAISTTTVAPPTMKLKLPSRLAGKDPSNDAETHIEYTARAKEATAGEAAGQRCSEDPVAGTSSGACREACTGDGLQSTAVDVEKTDGEAPQQGAVDAAGQGGQAASPEATPEATTPTAKPAKGRAMKATTTKATRGRGKAAAATAVPEDAPEPAAAGPSPGEDDAAAPAAGSSAGGKAKAKKSAKAARPKAPRVDPMMAAMEQAKVCRVEAEEGGDAAFSNTTLVVCPVVAAMQWRQEILRYMAPGSINVVLYHGTNRSDTFTRKQLEAADIVLTTYSILEVDFRRNIMAPKATCTFCGRKFKPERLKVHLRYFCGPWAEKTEAQARQQKKRAPWMMRRGGKGKGDDGKGKGGASTSAAAEAAAADEDADEGGAAGSPVEADSETEEEEEDDVAVAKAAVKAAGTRKGSAKKAPAATAKGKSTAKARPDSKAGTSGKAKAKAHKASNPAAKNAAKKRKTAATQDAVTAPPASDDDEAPVATPVRAAARAGKVTRSRAASLAAPPAAASGPMDVDVDAAPALPARKSRGRAAAPVGAKRTRSGAPKPAAKKRRPAGKGKSGGSDSDGSGTDWAPESDDEEQAADDAATTESELSDDDAVLSDAAEEETDAAGVEEEEEDVILVDEEEEPTGRGKSKGKGKGKAKRSKEEEEEEEQLEREVQAAAAKMIAKAQKERDQQVQGQSLLHQIRWRRVVLDEAHCIKDRRCNTAQSAFALTARYRWCLTGTPLQNRVNELYSLIRFLRLHPFSHYFADKTNCCSLDFPFKNDLRRCDLCRGSRMSHYCWWNRRIANPIKYNGYEGRGRTAMLILKHQILPVVLLRRTKLQCAADLALPPRTVVLRKDPFDRQEEDFYEALYTQSQAAFGGYVESGTLLNNYAHIFDLLIRLRQAVNHPYLVVYSATGGRNDSLAALPSADGAAAVVADATAEEAAQPLLGVCGICHDPLEDGLAAACGHAFCRVCVTEYLDNSVGATACPTCQRPLTIDLAAPSNASAAATGSSDGGKGKNGKGPGGGRAPSMFKKRSILSRINTAKFQSSTKLEALNEAIQRMLIADPSAKCIVFSQFTSMLDLAHFRLQQTGVQCVRLEGSMALDVRNRMIKAFNEDPSVTCFLMSLKAGGVALNLTVASHVMLMDPWWNPAVEQQAQDRIHRLGQYKPITVTRFVIAGTIEERILKLQEKKRLVFEGTVGRDAEALGKLTVDDLRFLFG